MNDLIRDQISEIKDGFSHKKHSGEDRNICRAIICHLSNRFNLLAGKGHQITVANSSGQWFALSVHKCTLLIGAMGRNVQCVISNAVQKGATVTEILQKYAMCNAEISQKYAMYNWVQKCAIVFGPLGNHCEIGRLGHNLTLMISKVNGRESFDLQRIT